MCKETKFKTVTNTKTWPLFSCDSQLMKQSVKGTCSGEESTVKALTNLEEGAHVSYGPSWSVEGRTPEKEGKKQAPHCSECPGGVLTGIKYKREKEGRGTKEKNNEEKGNQHVFGELASD